MGLQTTGRNHPERRIMERDRWKTREPQNAKKGFTLVEMIVVLVIMAVLAAVMIPSMIGWIDSAKEKQIVLEARSGYLAAQALVQEEYIKGTSYRDIDASVITDEDIDAIARTEGENTVLSVDENYLITEYTYEVTKNRTTYTARFDGDLWTVSH